MTQSKNYFMRIPGGENEGGNISPNNNDDKRTVIKQSSDAKKEEDSEKKSFGEKVHDALQEWSNDDQHDQEFDDTRV